MSNTFRKNNIRKFLLFIVEAIAFYIIIYFIIGSHNIILFITIVAVVIIGSYITLSGKYDKDMVKVKQMPQEEIEHHIKKGIMFSVKNSFIAMLIIWPIAIVIMLIIALVFFR
ncbi:hypothetical protein KKA15_01520 [Patescibacteria group bacterium]|nr:hypothetical protein [Patescibacteria group bacterium]